MRVDQDFGDIAVDLLHGIDVHAVSGDLRGLLVLCIQGLEALSIPFGLSHNACFVTIGLFFEP